MTRVSRVLSAVTGCAIGLFSLVGTVHANPIPGLFNTGVNGIGVALGDGATDPHYIVIENANAAAIVVNEPIPGTWVDNSGTYRWIWQTATGTPVNVTRTLRTTFDLTGLDASTASIIGQWATDNTGVNIFINGVATGNTCAGFTSLCNFSINSGFATGINTLDFRVSDVGVIAGLLVASISGTANPLAEPIPAPATLALLGLGLAGLGVARRRKAA